MPRRRDDCTGKRYFRSERLFVSNGLWYFATREGVDQGPFRSRALVERAIAAFVADVVAFTDGDGEAPVAFVKSRESAVGCRSTGCLERLRSLDLDPIE